AADAGGSVGTEQIRYRFNFAGRYYLILDSRDAGSFGTWTATGHVFCTNGVPLNDNCAGAVPIGCGAFNLSGNTQYANNDYHFVNPGTSCTGFSTDGRDVAYRLDVTTGDSIHVVYTSS